MKIFFKIAFNLWTGVFYGHRVLIDRVLTNNVIGVKPPNGSRKLFSFEGQIYCN